MIGSFNRVIINNNNVKIKSPAGDIMKNITLIKEVNKTIREKDEFELALEQSGIEFSMDDEQSDVSAAPNSELERIADHWREEGKDMSEDELRDAIGDELEQLEYSPEEISDGIDTVMSMIGGSDDEGMDDEMDMDIEMDMEPDVDEQQEHEDFEQADDYVGYGDEGTEHI